MLNEFFLLLHRRLQMYQDQNLNQTKDATKKNNTFQNLSFIFLLSIYFRKCFLPFFEAICIWINQINHYISRIRKIQIQNCLSIFSTSNLLVHYLHLIVRLDRMSMLDRIRNMFQLHLNSHLILVDVRYCIISQLNFPTNVLAKSNH